MQLQPGDLIKIGKPTINNELMYWFVSEDNNIVTVRKINEHENIGMYISCHNEINYHKILINNKILIIHINEILNF